MEAIEQDVPVTEDERRLLHSLRTWVGGPYLAALTEDQKEAFDSFVKSLRGSGHISNLVH